MEVVSSCLVAAVVCGSSIHCISTSALIMEPLLPVNTKKEFKSGIVPACTEDNCNLCDQCKCTS